uniref:Uncharacterized protein n=1 Tax=Panagrolaimus superbus TaxID=310955 RepID=A0A914YRW6_9BILA
MKPCCGFGKMLYITAMFTSVCLTVAALALPQWLTMSFAAHADINIALLDSDPYISGYLKAQWYFCAIVWAVIADFIAFFNFSAFGLACSQPTQCYLAMRRSAILSCFVFGQFLAVIIVFPLEYSSKKTPYANIELGTSFYLLCGAEVAALIGVICGFVTSQIMYNALERDWNKRYSLCSICLPY